MSTTELADTLGDWRPMLEDMNSTVQDMGRSLVDDFGYFPYRQSEWLSENRRSHVRASYAGGEWRVTLSELPLRNNSTSGGSDCQALAAIPIETIRVDVRHLARSGKSLPTSSDLVSQVRIIQIRERLTASN